MRLTNKRCLIVGGTSGLGLAAAIGFLDEGARVVVAGLPEHGAAAMQALSRHAGDVVHIGFDASDSRQVEALFGQVTGGGLDVLYHVAGMSGRKHGDGPLHECTDDGWQATVDVNLRSVFLTNRAAARHFLKQGGGVILNMASVLALSPSARYFDTCAYAAAKGGIIAMSRAAAARYAEHGIRINVIAPGLIETPMAARAVADADIRHFLATKQPLSHGPGRAEDCTGAAVFLCSDEARMMTGVVLPVDGGWCVSDGQWATGIA